MLHSDIDAPPSGSTAASLIEPPAVTHRSGSVASRHCAFSLLPTIKYPSYRFCGGRVTSGIFCDQHAPSLEQEG